MCVCVCVCVCNIRTKIKRWRAGEEKRGEPGGQRAGGEEGDLQFFLGRHDFEWKKKKMEAFEMRRSVLKEWKRGGGGGGESEEKKKTAGLEECGGEGEKPPHVKTNLHNSCSAPFRNSSFIRTGPLDCSNAVCARGGRESVRCAEVCS